MICELCLREEEDERLFEVHHLVPASGRKDSPTIVVDRQCGDQIHNLFQNYELKTKYYSLALLKENEKIQTWVKWVRNQPLEKRVTMAKKKRKR